MIKHWMRKLILRASRLPRIGSNSWKRTMSSEGSDGEAELPESREREWGDGRLVSRITFLRNFGYGGGEEAAEAEAEEEEEEEEKEKR